MGGMGGFNKPPPIPFNSNQQGSQQSVQEVMASRQKFIGSSKKIFEKLKQEHIGAV